MYRVRLYLRECICFMFIIPSKLLEKFKSSQLISSRPLLNLISQVFAGVFDCGNKVVHNEGNMFAFALVVSAYLISLCAEATEVLKCDGDFISK